MWIRAISILLSNILYFLNEQAKMFSILSFLLKSEITQLKRTYVPMMCTSYKQLEILN